MQRVLTSGRITWRQCCFLSILLNNVWSASSAKSRNENNWEHRPYLNARLRKELCHISAICGRVWKIISQLNSAIFCTSDRINGTNFRNPVFRVWGFSVWGLLISVGLKHPFGLIYIGLQYNFFPVGCGQDTGNSAVFFALAPPISETSGKFHDSIVHYPDLYGFATDSSEIRRIYLELWYILGITKNEAPIVWPGAANAPIGVKWNPAVYCMHQQIPDPDRSTFVKMAPEKPVFGL